MVTASVIIAYITLMIYKVRQVATSYPIANVHFDIFPHINWNAD